jgi:hypothetical protein
LVFKECRTLRVFGGMQMIQILRAKHSYPLFCNVHAVGT